MHAPSHTHVTLADDSWLGYYSHANDYWSKNLSLFSTGMLDNCLNDVSMFNVSDPFTGDLLKGNGFRDFSLLNATYRGGAPNATALASSTFENDASNEPASSPRPPTHVSRSHSAP